jgi:hypothetical protein
MKGMVLSISFCLVIRLILGVRRLQLRLGKDGGALNLDVGVERERLDGDAARGKRVSSCGRGWVHVRRAAHVLTGLTSPQY